MTARAASVAAALQAITGALTVIETEMIALPASLGRILAEDVVSPIDLPPWTNAAMDGYACRADDIRAVTPGGPVRLPVVETIGAGAFPSRALAPGEVMRIMTGAPVPEGADTVVRVEDTDADAELVTIRSSRDALRNLRSRGADIGAGDVAVTAGAMLGPAEIAMLAAVAAAEIEAFLRPRVAILASGDELAPVESADDVRAGRRIVSANNYSLAACVREAGGEPTDLGIVPDDPTALRDAIEKALNHDLLVTSGGISVGGFDYTRAAIEALGGTIHFWRVPMRPGYNSAFGFVRGTPWIGVPGNPVSALVAGEVLVKPAVRRLAGARAVYPRLQSAVAAETLTGTRGATVFLRGALEARPGERPLARPTGAQGSAILSSSVRADALLVIAPGAAIEAGQPVQALLLRDTSSQAPGWDFTLSGS